MHHKPVQSLQADEKAMKITEMMQGFPTGRWLRLETQQEKAKKEIQGGHQLQLTGVNAKTLAEWRILGKLLRTRRKGPKGFMMVHVILTIVQ
jgi:hypothetical protein